MKSRWMTVLAGLLIPFVLGMSALAAAWPQYARTAGHQPLTEASLPAEGDTTELVFNLQARPQESTDVLSNLIVTDDALFAAAGPDLMKISPQGQILKRVTLPRPVSAYTPFIAAAGDLVLTYGYDGSSGQVQAFSMEDLALVWTSPELAGLESFSPLTVYDDILYLPLSAYDYTAYSVLPGVIAAISTNQAAETDTDWLFMAGDETQAYYWNGVAVSDQAVYAGSTVGRIDVYDRNDGQLIDQFDSGLPIKSTLSLNDGILYFGTDRGIAAVNLDDNGLLAEETLRQLDLGDQVTAAPAVWQQRLYVGTGGFTGGSGMTVVDLDSWSVAYQVRISGFDSWSGEPLESAGIQSAPVIAASNDTAQVYFTINAKPSPLLMLMDKSGQTTADVRTLFTPQEAEQNGATMPLSASESGQLYYSNDAGILFAVRGSAPAATPLWNRNVLIVLITLAGLLAIGLLIQFSSRAKTRRRSNGTKR
ncbi:MAG: hypothetical protein PHX55_02475 [Eubacteriales bacterium]|nr:hypothetical protein [Eubacteriales bacterium]MDD4461795.1 hypothetical protein [Eubacteriales bacterium]